MSVHIHNLIQKSLIVNCDAPTTLIILFGRKMSLQYGSEANRYVPAMHIFVRHIRKNLNTIIKSWKFAVSL